MRWWLQEVRKAWCPHNWRVKAFDARVLDTEGNQYELEQCNLCLEFRRGALVKRRGEDATAN